MERELLDAPNGNLNTLYAEDMTLLPTEYSPSTRWHEAESLELTGFRNGMKDIDGPKTHDDGKDIEP